MKMNKKVLMGAILLAGLMQNANADFGPLGNGWYYNDQGSHKAFTHIVGALNQVINDMCTFADNMETGDYPIANAVLFNSRIAMNICPSLHNSGVGESEQWYKCIMKHGGSPVEAVAREINWILEADPQKGIWLNYNEGKKQWHVGLIGID